MATEVNAATKLDVSDAILDRGFGDGGSQGIQ